MNAPATEMTTAPKSFTCGKCSGRGSLNWTRVANGVCFWCQGTGKLAAPRDLTNERWFRQNVNLAKYTADIVMEAAGREDEKRAEFYARLLVRDLFKLGTVGAREVLNYVGAGEYWTRENGGPGECKTLRTEIAQYWRTRLIEIGREMQAAA